MYATFENPHSIRPPFFGLPIRQVPNNALSAIWSQFRSLGHRLNGYEDSNDSLQDMRLSLLGEARNPSF